MCSFRDLRVTLRPPPPSRFAYRMVLPCLAGHGVEILWFLDGDTATPQLLFSFSFSHEYESGNVIETVIRYGGVGVLNF